MPTVAQLFYDTVRVLQEYRVALRSHALHAYHSAFVTMPECSLLHALQQENLPGSLPSMVSPRVLHWGSWNRVIDGHTREVVCVAVSPDGQRIVSGSRDGTLRVWSAVTLEELAKVTQGKAYTCSIAFSPDGARFVTSSMAGSIHLWDFVTLQQLVALDLNRDAISQLGRASLNCKAFHAIFSNDATRIIASAGAEVCIWGAATFEELGRFNASAPLALSPDDTRVVACLSGTMTEPAVYDATTCEELFQLENLAADVHAIAFSPDGRQVVFGLTGNSLRVWNAITWEEVARLQTGPSIGSVTSITFSPCRTHMVSASADQALHIWDTTSAYKEISKLRGHEGLALAVVFSPDGTQLVSGSEDKTVRIWNAKDFGDSLGLEDDRVRRKWARDISFLPCGSRITTHSVDEPFSVWDAETSTKLGEIQDVPLSHESPVVVSSLDGSLITTRYGPHHSLRVWDTATFEMVAELERQFDVETSFVCAAFSPDNTRIVSGMRNGAVLAWSILNSEVLVEFNQQNGRIKCIAYSPGGSHFAAGDDFALRVWSTATYEELYVYHSPRPAACLEFSHDGARLVTLFSPRKGPLKDTICVVWSVDTFEVLAQIKSDFYREPIFTADGKGVLFYHHDRVDGITSAWMPSQADNGTHGPPA
jgi:WD40 repeat protein